MKIALCLSGQPRNIKIGYKFIQKYILDPNKLYEIDIFCHSWFDSQEIGKSYSSAQQYEYGYVGKVEENIDKFIINNIKPKKYIIEKQIDFNDYSKTFISHSNAKQDMLSSMFYSMYISNKLKKEYEIENNFIYDLVVRTRYDLAYFEPITFLSYKNSANKVAVLKNYQEDQDMMGSANKPMPDIFSFSNSKNMDIFCEVYPNMQKINKQLDVPFAERYLGEWVRVQNKLELEYINKKVVILHRMPRSNTV
jgi:hypothetical protein